LHRPSLRAAVRDYPELLANFAGNFFGWNAANFGCGGDRTQNILWRLDNGELPPRGSSIRADS
jgi:hypothetical protein